MNRLIVLLLLFPLHCYSADDDIPYRSVKSETFNYLEYSHEGLRSNHAIKILLKIPDGFRPVDPSNHFLIFNNNPFNVSVAILIGTDSIIMVHAEHAVNDSGVLDYSALPVAQIGQMEFHTDSNCIEPSDALMNIHHDFRYLSESGFDPRPAIYVKQFMRNTNDFKSEYIISYAKRVANCSEETVDDPFKTQLGQEIKSLLSISEILSTR